MLQLPNDCRIGKISVYPKNWENSSAPLNVEWLIKYHFHDPKYKVEFPYGKPRVVKGDVNRFKSAKERQGIIRYIIKEEIRSLLSGFNPLEGYVQKSTSSYVISPNTYWIAALQKALERKKIQPHTLSCFQSALKNIKAAAIALDISRISITNIKRRDLIACLEYLKDGKHFTKGSNKTFGAASYNRNKDYLRSLFEKLIELDVIEFNPAEKIKKLQEIAKVREVLTPEEIEKISNELPVINYPLFRYIHIFYQSGARSTELLNVKKEDVSLINREYKVTILKGKNRKETVRAITLEALPFWTELVQIAEPGDYLLGEGLKPNKKKGRPDGIRIRWHNYVQEKLGINKTFYGLKHLYLTRLSEIKGQAAAANHAGHTDGKMVAKVYDINSAKRTLEEGKELRISL